MFSSSVTAAKWDLRLVAEHRFVIPDRLFSWTFIAQRGCHLQVDQTHFDCRLLSNILDLLPLPTVVPEECLDCQRCNRTALRVNYKWPQTSYRLQLRSQFSPDLPPRARWCALGNNLVGFKWSLLTSTHNPHNEASGRREFCGCLWENTRPSELQ